MFWDIRILPVPEVPGPTSVAELTEKMKSMQYMIKVSERPAHIIYSSAYTTHTDAATGVWVRANTTCRDDGAGL